jgi:hypothetical protein
VPASPVKPHIHEVVTRFEEGNQASTYPSSGRWGRVGEGRKVLELDSEVRLRWWSLVEVVAARDASSAGYY